MRPSRRQVLSGGAALAAFAIVRENPGRWDVTDGLWPTGSLEPSKWLLAPEELRLDGYHFVHWDLRAYDQPSRRTDWDLVQPSTLQREWPARTIPLLDRLPTTRYDQIDEILLIESPLLSYPSQDFRAIRYVAVFTGSQSFLERIHEDGEETFDDGEESPRYDGFQYYPGRNRAVGTVDGTAVVVDLDFFHLPPDGHDPDDGRPDFGVLQSLIDARRGRAPRLQDTDEAVAAVVERLSWDGITAGVAAEYNRFFDLVQPRRRGGSVPSVESAGLEFTPESDAPGSSVDVDLVLATDGPIADGEAFANRIPALESWPGFEVGSVDGDSIRVQTSVDADLLRQDPAIPETAPLEIDVTVSGDELTVRHAGGWSFLRGELKLLLIHGGTWRNLDWSGPDDARFVREGDELTVQNETVPREEVEVWLLWSPDFYLADGRGGRANPLVTERVSAD